jgi:hypothetical protein
MVAARPLTPSSDSAVYSKFGYRILMSSIAILSAYTHIHFSVTFNGLLILEVTLMSSAFKQIISQLQKQKIAIERAIAALQEVGDEGFDTEAPTAVAKKTPARKRTMSPEARKRISEAVRKRWAAAKKATKKAARTPKNTA